MFEKNIETTEVVTLDHQQKKPTKAELKKMEEAQRKQDLEAQRRGMEMMAAIVQKTLTNIKSVKTDINLFLAELTGSDVSTIENLGIKEYTTLIVTFFQKPELADFFLLYRHLVIDIQDGEFKLKDRYTKDMAIPLNY